MNADMDTYSECNPSGLLEVVCWVGGAGLVGAIGYEIGFHMTKNLQTLLHDI